MPRSPPPGFYLITVVCLFLTFILYTRNMHHDPKPLPEINWKPAKASISETPVLAPETQQGAAVMSHLGNETLKAELGRAAWKLFHTTFARFPDTPTADESDALKSYIYLFARLYPCGECAAHFQEIIKKFPPQTSSRSVAAAWGCHVHNEVNKIKGKELFDCGNIGDFYDCGCGKDEKEGMSKKGAQAAKNTTGLHEEVEISREGPIDGG